MFYIKFIFLVFFAAALSFSGVSKAGDEKVMILSQDNARKMFFECMKLQRTGQKDPSDYFMCRRSCDDYTRLFTHDFTDFDMRATKSEECRSSYFRVTGVNVEPTLPKEYMQPKGSARN